MRLFLLISVTLLLTSCKPDKKETKQSEKQNNPYDFVIAFGSCNNQNLPNPFWNEILQNNPNIWIWGGDIIYADTDNMKLMKSYYDQVKNDSVYSKFSKKAELLGTWDDHDYGLNDGGEEYTKKDSAQQLFLDFFDVSKNDIRRTRKGVYNSKTYTINNKTIKVIVLDTRYFRTPLSKDPTGEKRYIPDTTSSGTMLGEEQWEWLENELKNTTADFNIIMSSVQFLSYEHGFESWGNMPHEVKKLKNLIVNSKANNVILLSGDRHISEISSVKIDSLSYPLIDFTSSGLTHSYTSYSFEPNQYRITDVINDKSYGLLNFDLNNNKVVMEIRGANNKVLATYTQQY